MVMQVSMADFDFKGAVRAAWKKWADAKIAKAEQYLGDVMYEWFDGDLTRIELATKEELRSCRWEALFDVMRDGDQIEEVLNYWEQRGF